MHKASLATLAEQFTQMPAVRAMAIRPLDYDGRRLRLLAPLNANVNDKGCAFGGSLASAMTLAAWGLLVHKLTEAGLRAEVFVADSKLRYLTPLYQDLVAEAWLAPETSWEDFLAVLTSRGRARACLHARVADPAGGDATRMQARFAAFASRNG